MSSMPVVHSHHEVCCFQARYVRVRNDDDRHDDEHDNEHVRQIPQNLDDRRVAEEGAMNWTATAHMITTTLAASLRVVPSRLNIASMMSTTMTRPSISKPT